jgi:hypothetical protein
MIHSKASFTTAPEPGLVLLRQKIGWICHAVRAMSVAYAVWVLVLLLRFWSSEARVVQGFSSALHAMIPGASELQRLAGFSVQMVCWFSLLGTVICVWRLFGGFLQGSILTVDASRRLMLVGVVGALTTGLAVLAEPLLAMIVSAQLASAPDLALSRYLNPLALLELTFCAILIALAHVFKVAAELADENRGFV